MGGRSGATTIAFDAVVERIDAFRVIRLPGEASRRLPSRGQVAVRVSLGDLEFRTVLEPDGKRGHWLNVDQEVRDSARVDAGDKAAVVVEILGDWPEPEVPGDLRSALDAASASIRDVWHDITPMARWEWVRWVNATANIDTRRRRVEVSISKLGSGKRRPCCFDLAACTDPAVSRSGKLRPPDPAPAT